MHISDWSSDVCSSDLRNSALCRILNAGQHEIGDAAPFQRRRVLDQRLLLRRHAGFQSLSAPASWRGAFQSLCVGHSFLLILHYVRPIAVNFKRKGVVIRSEERRGGKEGVRKGGLRG